ncbi:transcription antitermination NusB family protein [Candidatus Fokinia crypta]|uniref:Transcription antitermination protein NusB n=1 Tax=Candidatus Fokinia crypta TaxID=1920990 RepID=A0ABZ0USQ4_9RICK|nr:transcription antitermination factor NusB [Candidatus Fokinia cryptica]WPX98054.1 transcription antitermination protein NusB [Candidatus Fokinia cryptica]
MNRNDRLSAIKILYEISCKSSLLGQSHAVTYVTVSSQYSDIPSEHDNLECLGYEEVDPLSPCVPFINDNVRDAVSYCSTNYFNIIKIMSSCLENGTDISMSYMLEAILRCAFYELSKKVEQDNAIWKSRIISEYLSIALLFGQTQRLGLINHLLDACWEKLNSSSQTLIEVVS